MCSCAIRVRSGPPCTSSAFLWQVYGPESSWSWELGQDASNDTTAIKARDVPINDNCLTLRTASLSHIDCQRLMCILPWSGMDCSELYQNDRSNIIGNAIYRDQVSFRIANGGKKARFVANLCVGVEPTPPTPEEQGMPAFAN